MHAFGLTLLSKHENIVQIIFIAHTLEDACHVSLTRWPAAPRASLVPSFIIESRPTNSGLELHGALPKRRARKDSKESIGAREFFGRIFVPVHPLREKSFLMPLFGMMGRKNESLTKSKKEKNTEQAIDTTKHYYYY